MNIADRLHRWSLRRTLLVVLFPGVLAVFGAELWLTWRTAVDAANAAYDRSLLGAIKAMDANISTESGGLSVELPYTMLEFFELTASGEVFYRVATEGGLVEIGNADMPQPQSKLLTGKPQFFDATYFGQPVRVGSYARVLDRPIGRVQGPQRVIIQVAETLGSRQAFTRALVWQGLQRDAVLLAIAAVLLAVAVSWSIAPVARLRQEVQARRPDDLAPVDTARIPADVRPLVDAINHHIRRYSEQMESRRQFVDDASHQLRTPLTTLSTQVAFALRETDPRKTRDALDAIGRQVESTIRQTNQMLALARADTAQVPMQRLDLVALVEKATREWWSRARARSIELTLDVQTPVLPIAAHPGLLQEAFSNLLDNALRYTPEGGAVAVRLERDDAFARVTVSDSGPGLPPDELARVGERFFRSRQVAQPGSGLGLAIAQSVARRHGGSLGADNATAGTGLVVSLRLRLADLGPVLP